MGEASADAVETAGTIVPDSTGSAEQSLALMSPGNVSIATSDPVALEALPAQALPMTSCCDEGEVIPASTLAMAACLVPLSSPPLCGGDAVDPTSGNCPDEADGTGAVQAEPSACVAAPVGGGHP